MTLVATLVGASVVVFLVLEILPGYVDTTGINPFNIEKAKALLKKAGVTTPLELTMTLPPPYARQGGEVIAAQLAKVGIVARLQNVEWAQWLSGTYTNKNYDLTLISHVEPFDLGNFAKPGYYGNYESPKFNELYDKIKNAPGGGTTKMKLTPVAGSLRVAASPLEGASPAAWQSRFRGVSRIGVAFHASWVVNGAVEQLR